MDIIVEPLIGLYDLGGPVVALLAALSVVAVAIILFKIWKFAAIGLGRHGKLDRALKHWIAGDRAVAIDLTARLKSPSARATLHAMRGQSSHPETADLVREDVERVAIDELAKARSLIRVLETIGQVAPLLGLFGTVIGMIEAFQALQSAGASVDPSVLAGGIWVALLTTAVGLAVAIPASLCASWLDARVEGEQRFTEASVTTVMTGRLTDGSTRTQPVLAGSTTGMAGTPHAA